MPVKEGMSQDHVLTDEELDEKLKGLLEQSCEKEKVIRIIWGSVENARTDAAWNDDARTYVRELTKLRREWCELRLIKERRAKEASQ